MSELLRRWLRDEAGVSLPLASFEQEFSSGYAFGELFQKYNLQPDFDKFDKRSVPDAYINNYTRLESTFNSLGIPMDSRVANSLMREEPGVALQLVSAIRQALKRVNTDLKKVSTGALSRTYGTHITTNKGLLEATSYSSQKEKYAASNVRQFEDVLRLRSANPNKLMESAHLRPFDDEFAKQANSANFADAQEKEAHQAARTGFRQALLDKMATDRQDKRQKGSQDAALHASLIRQKNTLERDQLRTEMAVAEVRRRKQLAQQEAASHEVLAGIDSFEMNMQRLVGGTDEGEGGVLPPIADASVKVDTQAALMATWQSTTDHIAEQSAEYVRSVRNRQQQEAFMRKEREARRKRLLVEQASAAEQAHFHEASDSMLEAVRKDSLEEQRLASRLWQLRQEEEVMRANRQLREQQYAARRDQDWTETLQRELQLHRSLKDEYAKRAEMELASWRQAEAQRAAERSTKHHAMAYDIVGGLLQVAERCIDFREQTNGAKLPAHMWHQWAAMFVAGDPALGENLVSFVKNPRGRPGPADEAALVNYLACSGQFEQQPSVGHNEALARMVGEMAARVQPWGKKEQAEPVPDLPLKLAVLGAPFAGKSSVTMHLGRTLGVVVLNPESLVTEALKAAADYAALEAAAPDAPLTPAEDGAEGAPVLDPPSSKALLGGQLRSVLESGQPVPDELLVALVVAAIREAPSRSFPKPLAPADPKAKGKGAAKPRPGSASAVPPPTAVQGYILDGFPRTEAQAVMLERALTGLDLAAEQAALDAASQLAPPPADCLPNVHRPLNSGLDAVIVLDQGSAELALRRALGRRMDPTTGDVYHLEFSPPPANDPGLSERLQEVTDDGNDAQQMQQRLSVHQAESAPLDMWLTRFHKLRRPIHGGGTLEEVLLAAADVAASILRAKAAAASTRAAAESAVKAQAAAEKAQDLAEAAQKHAAEAASKLLDAKRAELQAAQLLTDNKKGTDVPATELLKAQSSLRCAEQLKAAKAAATEAADAAQRSAAAAEAAAQQVERARATMVDATISAEAGAAAAAAATEAEATCAAAAAAAAKAEAAAAAAATAAADAERFSGLSAVTPDVALTPQPPAEAPQPIAGGSAPGALPLPISTALFEQWQTIESGYLEGMRRGFCSSRESQTLALSQLSAAQAHFRRFLGRADGKAALLARFQAAFNAVDVDVRGLPETRGELLLRCDELRDALWEVCDKKGEENEQERVRLGVDGLLADHAKLLAASFVELVQVELDRFNATRGFIITTVHCQLGAPPPEQEPAVSVSGGVVPPEWKDRVEGKGALPVPEQVTSLALTAPALATALKLAYAVAAAQSDLAAPDPKKKAPPAAGKKVDPEQEAAQRLEEALLAAAGPLVRREGDILTARLQLLSSRAATWLDELLTIGASLSQRLQQSVGARLRGECAAVAALDRVTRAAAVAGKCLTTALELRDEELIVDEGVVVVPEPAVHQPVQVDHATAPPGVLTHDALALLATAFEAASSSPYIRIHDAAELLCRLAGQGVLPSAWRDSSVPSMIRAVSSFDPMQSGYVDWREVVATLTLTAMPVVMTSTCADFAATCSACAAADADADGQLTEREWQSVRLWFQLKEHCSKEDSSPEAQQRHEAGRKLKALLWQMVAAPPPSGEHKLLDYRAALLLCCPDRDLFSGVKKAFCITSGSLSSNAKATAEQVFKAMYPTGVDATCDIARFPVDLPEVTSVLSTVYTARGGDPKQQAAVTAEQFMYSGKSEKIMNGIMARYHWRDLYNATRLTG